MTLSMLFGDVRFGYDLFDERTESYTSCPFACILSPAIISFLSSLRDALNSIRQDLVIIGHHRLEYHVLNTA